MSQTQLTVPHHITFEEAIELTQNLINQMEKDEVAAQPLQETIMALVATENGARGFFVTYLTSDSPVADQPLEAVLAALNTSPEIVSELLVKNVAMSTAMGITHRRQDNETMAQGSDRVQKRSLNLIQQLNQPTAKQKAQQMRNAALTGEGKTEIAFFERWGYDQQQRNSIAQQLEKILSHST